MSHPLEKTVKDTHFGLFRIKWREIRCLSTFKFSDQEMFILVGKMFLNVKIWWYTHNYRAIKRFSNRKLRNGSDLPSLFKEPFLINPVIFFIRFSPFLVYVLVYYIYEEINKHNTEFILLTLDDIVFNPRSLFVIDGSVRCSCFVTLHHNVIMSR